MTDVWVVIADFGNSQEAEECVDSVWSAREAAHARAESMVVPKATRVEIQTLDPYVVAGPPT